MQDCLVRICEYINVFDMMNLSESSKHSELFMDFFKERVVNLNLIDFSKTPIQSTASFQKAFEHFGSCMRKVKVSILITFL